MIIDCPNCDKKFEIDKKLILPDGRLLQCGSCNHKWFFTKQNINKIPDSVKVDNKEKFQLLDDNSKFESISPKDPSERKLENPSWSPQM